MAASAPSSSRVRCRSPAITTRRWVVRPTGSLPASRPSWHCATTASGRARTRGSPLATSSTRLPSTASGTRATASTAAPATSSTPLPVAPWTSTTTTARSTSGVRRRGRSSPPPAASSPRWAAPAAIGGTGTRRACEPGCRTATGTACSPCRPPRSQRASTR